MTYQIQVTLSPAPGLTWTQTFTARSRQWGCLESRCYHDGRIVIPPDQFAYSKKVPDVRRWRYTRGEPLRRLEPGEELLPTVVALNLESPHLHEYSADFQPIEPLMNPRSNTRVQKYLPAMLGDEQRLASILGQPTFRLTAADIVLINPIPFQASLVRLWLPEYRGTMLSSVRNNTWNALWEAEYQGVKLYQEDYLERLRAFSPTLVINACTAALKEQVTALLRRRTSYPVMEATSHPSYWDSKTQLV